MKKIIYLLASGIMFSSCEKLDLGYKDILHPPKNVSYTEYSENYENTVFDSCRNENVLLKGLETYKITESKDNSNGYYLKYEIDLTGIIGTGEITHSRYSGGGKIVNELRENADRTTVLGQTAYKVVYKTTTGQELRLNQSAYFIKVNDKVKVDYNSGYTESCK